MSDSGALRDLLRGAAQPDRVLPPNGSAAALTLLATAVLACVAVIALALVLATGRLADRWGAELSGTATVRLLATGEQTGEQIETALRVLESAPGVAEARALDSEEQAALLAPWLGRDLPLDLLPVPRLIAVTETAGGLDAQALGRRLAEAVPGAVLDDHAGWRRPLARAASRLRVIGWLSLTLIAAGLAAVSTLAAQATLDANAQVVAVLRTIGARDRHIARAFVRRLTAHELAGAAIGTALGYLVVLATPAARPEGGVLTGLGFQGWHWLWPLAIPPLAGGMAHLATRVAARRKLEGIP